MNADDLDSELDEFSADFDLLSELRRQSSLLLIEHLEPRTWIHDAQTGRTVFRCPECQKLDAAIDDDNDFEWSCEGCAASGTKFGLLRRVVESPDALRRALAHLPGAYGALTRGEIR